MAKIFQQVGSELRRKLARGELYLVLFGIRAVVGGPERALYAVRLDPSTSISPLYDCKVPPLDVDEAMTVTSAVVCTKGPAGGWRVELPVEMSMLPVNLTPSSTLTVNGINIYADG